MSSPDLMMPCECGCKRGQHHSGRGMCNGYKCRCSRFVKRTPRFEHIEKMQAALSFALEIIEALPGKGRSIQVGLPDEEERRLAIAQIKRAMANQ